MMRKFPGDGRARHLLVGLCLAVYCCFGLAWITLPGLEADELLFLNPTMLFGRRLYVHASFWIFGREIPTMAYSYVGTVKTWLWELLFLVWSPSVYSVRIPAVLLGGLALLLFYWWARRCYSSGAALLALALAAADPSYLFTARLDWGPVLLSHVFMAAGLLLGTVWYQNTSEPPKLSGSTLASGGTTVSDARRMRFLGGAGFCFGLGLWDKATFIWFLASLAASLLVLFPTRVLQVLRPRAVAIFAGCLIIGSLPLLVYNVESGRQGTAEMVRLEELRGDVLANKVENLRLSLWGKSVNSVVGDGMDHATGQMPPGLATGILDFLAAFNDPFGRTFLWLFCIAAALATFAARRQPELLFPFLVAALMWAQMMLTKGGGVSVHHYVLAYPLPQLGVAAVTCRIWQLANRWGKLAIASAIAVVLLGELSWDARYLQLFQQSGGRRYWTDAIYDIAEFVRQRNPTPLVILDYGFSPQLQLLTQGQVALYEDFGAYHPDKLMELVREPNVLFLSHAKGLESYAEGRAWLDEVAPKEGVRCRTVRNFFEREGRLVASLFRCQMAEYSAASAVSLPALKTSP